MFKSAGAVDVRGRGDHSTLDLFEAPIRPPVSAGALAGLKTQVAHLMSAVIRGCGIDRYEVAAKMSALLGEDVSKPMLDAYTAESRDDQNVPLYRFLAFVAATDSFTALDDLMQRIGCRVLVGDEARLAALTRLQICRDQLDQHIREMKRRIKGGQA